MNHLFISYSRKNEAEVSRLVTRIKDKGIEVWQDVLGKEGGIPFSTKWFDAIEDALYQASGAVIIHTKEWMASSPCSKEYELIEKNSIPFIFVETEDLSDQTELLRRILEWYEGKVRTEGNLVRTYLFAQGKKVSRDRNINHLFPKSQRLLESISEIGRLSLYKRFFKEEGFADKNPEAAEWIYHYIKKGKHKLIGDQIKKAIIAVAGAVAGITAYTLVMALPEAMEMVNNSNKALSAMGIARSVAEFDPVEAISFFTTEAHQGQMDPKTHLNSMQSLMTGLLDVKYPEAFYKYGSVEADRVSKAVGTEKTSGRYSVIYDDNGGGICLTDSLKDLKKHIQVPCIPTAHTFIEEKNEFIVACENKVLVYDIVSSIEPIQLSYNYESIKEIRYDADNIYGVTDKGNVVSWTNPIPKRDESISGITDAKIIEDKGGEPSAFYISEGKLFLKSKKGTKQLATHLNNVICMDVSPSGLEIAAVNENSKKKTVMLISADSGEVKWSSTVEDSIRDIVFSSDGKMIYANSLNALYSFEQATGKAELQKAREKFLLYSLVPYNDHLIVADTRGWAAEFGKDLTRKGSWFCLLSGAVPAKQMAVSYAKDSILTANRGGAKATNCSITNIKTGKSNALPIMSNDYIISSSAVATSENGEFAVFGYPNGKVSVWDTDALNLLYENCSISEDIVAMSFAIDNASLMVLGKSGTIYRIGFNGFVKKVDKDNPDNTWVKYKDSAARIHAKMYDLGLTYISP